MMAREEKMSTVLEVRNVCKNYNNFSLKNVSFCLEKGTITGFIGENGAGKTTTLSAIMNLIHTDSGEIYLRDKQVRKTQEMKGVSYLESNRDLYPDVMMDDYKYFVSQAYRKTWSEEKYQKYRRQFHIENAKKIKELSTGMKAKFYLAVELAKQPELILLDEPTSGLDPLARNELLEILKQLVKEEHITIFFSSHITSDIEHIADRVVFIHNGEILLNKEKREICSNYKRLDISAIQNFTEKEMDCLKENGIKNFDYYIIDQHQMKEIRVKNCKDASLDDVLMFLTGGVRVD